jgi:transposase
MQAKRTKHTQEFKTEAVRLATQPDKKVAGVADSLGIKEHLLYRWIRELRAQGTKAFPGNGVVSRDEELFRLQRDLKRVTEERDFLKKTVAFFARENR